MHWAEQFSNAKGWDNATRILMLAGKELPILSTELRTDNMAISGCESPVWLQISVNQETKTLHCAAYSPGKIVRGLIQLVIEPIQSQPVDYFCQFDFYQYMAHLKLTNMLSPSRQGGINAVVGYLISKQQGLLLSK